MRTAQQQLIVDVLNGIANELEDRTSQGVLLPKPRPWTKKRKASAISQLRDIKTMCEAEFPLA